VSPLRRSGPRVRRIRKGVYQIRLPDEERAALRTLCDELREMLAAEDPSLSRLYPPAYTDDPAAADEYARLMRDDLTEGHLQAIETMERTLESQRLDEDEMSGWLAALNDMRLALGTRLDVTEDMYESGMAPEDPRAPRFAVYQYLGYLEEQVVEAVARSLDARGGS